MQLLVNHIEDLCEQAPPQALSMANVLQAGDILQANTGKLPVEDVVMQT